MNLLGKGTISAALFAATASVVMVAPAQAISLNGGSMSFMGSPVTWTSGGVGDYSFNFGDGVLGFTTICDGAIFLCPDGISFNDFDISGGVITETAVVTGINTSEGTNISFFATSANVTETPDGITLGLFGFFSDVDVLGNPTGSTAFGNGKFSTQLAGSATTFSGDLEAVPTPAAVLPVLGGLLGMASKRKRNEENA